VAKKLDIQEDEYFAAKKWIQMKALKGPFIQNIVDLDLVGEVFQLNKFVEENLDEKHTEQLRNALCVRKSRKKKAAQKSYQAKKDALVKTEITKEARQALLVTAQYESVTTSELILDIIADRYKKALLAQG